MLMNIWGWCRWLPCFTHIKYHKMPFFGRTYLFSSMFFHRSQFFSSQIGTDGNFVQLFKTGRGRRGFRSDFAAFLRDWFWWKFYQTGTPHIWWERACFSLDWFQVLRWKLTRPEPPSIIGGKWWRNPKIWWEKPGKTGNNCVFFVDALFHDPTGRDPSWSRAPYVIQLRMDNEGGIWCVARHIKGGSHG